MNQPPMEPALRVGAAAKPLCQASPIRRVLARLFACLAFLALANVASVPLTHASPKLTQNERAVLELRQTFGDAFRLCVSDDGASAPDPSRHGAEDCPLCCLHSSAPIVPRIALLLPDRYPISISPARPLQDANRFPPARASPAQARAPPKIPA